MMKRRIRHPAKVSNTLFLLRIKRAAGCLSRVEENKKQKELIRVLTRLHQSRYDKIIVKAALDKKSKCCCIKFQQKSSTRKWLEKVFWRVYSYDVNSDT